MGVVKNISYDAFPKQGDSLNKRIKVSFDYDTERFIMGTVVRDDTEDPFRTIIALDDGRYILTTECQYRLPK